MSFSDVAYAVKQNFFDRDVPSEIFTGNTGLGGTGIDFGPDEIFDEADIAYPDIQQLENLQLPYEPCKCFYVRWKNHAH